jgi:bifunctional DNA-binding transcriptional regulator/antitoxin component of YhaV-PrlF toxin-antitoxin module
MTARFSTKGQVMLPSSFHRKLDLREGDALDLPADGASIILTSRNRRARKVVVLADLSTGLPVLDVEGSLPPLISEDVEEMLADFP